MADRLFRLWVCLLVVNCLAPKTGYCTKVSMNPFTWSSARERFNLWVPRIKYTSFSISVEEEPRFSIPANQKLWVGHYLSYKYFTYLGCSIPASFPMNEVQVPKQDIGFCQSRCNTSYIGQRVRDKACFCFHKVHLANQTDCSDTDSENLLVYKELPDGKIEGDKLEDKASKSTSCLFVEYVPTAYERWELRDCTESRGTWCAKGQDFSPSGGNYSWHDALSVCGSGSKLPQITPRYTPKHAIDTWTALKRDLVVRNIKVDVVTPRLCGYIEQHNTTSAIQLQFENCETSKRFVYSDGNEESGEIIVTEEMSTIDRESGQTSSRENTSSRLPTSRDSSNCASAQCREPTVNTSPTGETTLTTNNSLSTTSESTTSEPTTNKPTTSKPTTTTESLEQNPAITVSTSTSTPFVPGQSKQTASSNPSDDDLSTEEPRLDSDSDSTGDSSGGGGNMLLVAVIVSVGLVIIGVFVVVLCVIRRRKRKQAVPQEDPDVVHPLHDDGNHYAEPHYAAPGQPTPGLAEAGYYEVGDANTSGGKNDTPTSDVYDKLNQYKMTQKQAPSENVYNTTNFRPASNVYDHAGRTDRGQGSLDQSTDNIYNKPEFSAPDANVYDTAHAGGGKGPRPTDQSTENVYDTSGRT